MTEGRKEEVAGRRFGKGSRTDGGRSETVPLHPAPLSGQFSTLSEQHCRTLFEAMGEGFALHEIICDASGRPCDYRFLEVNPAFERQTGLKATELIGRTVREVLPDIEPLWIERYGRVALTGQPEQFEAPSEALGRHFEVRAYQTGPGRFATVFTDITDRKRAARTTHELALFPEQNPFPVLRIDVAGTLLYANSGAAALLETWKCRVGQTTPKKIRRAIAQALTTGELQEIEVSCGPTLYSFAIAPIQAERYANLYGRDITERKATEEALRRSERRYRSFIDVTSQFAWVTNPAGLVVEDIPALRAFTGQTYEQAQGVGWADALHPDDVQPTLAVWNRAVSAKTCYETEYRMRRHDGAYRLLLARGVPILDDQGNVIEWVGTCIDITESKAAEDALRQSEQRFRQVAESLPQLVWTCQADGSCDYLSPQWVDYTGMPEAPQLGYGWLAQVHPDDRNRVVTTWEATAAMGDDFQIEFRIRRHDGVYRWFRTLAVPLRDEAGQIVKWFGSNTDIQDIQEAERELRQSQEDLARAQAVGQIGSWRLDVRRDVLTWSDENHRIFGLPKGAPMTYETFLGAIHPSDRQSVDAQWQAALQGEPYDIEHRIVVDGRIKWVREKAYLEFDEQGKLLGGFGITQDITDRKTAEQALQKANEQFQVQAEELAAVNEELRTQTEELQTQAEDLRKSEEELRSSEQRLRWALQGAAGGAWDWDLTTGQAWWSDEMFDLWGVEPGTPMNLDNTLPIIQAEDRQRLQAAVEDAVEQGTDYRCEFRIRHSQRGERWMASYGRLVRDRSGKPVRLLGISLDITERKRTEESIRRQAVILRSINRILTESLSCQTDAELGQACLTIAEQVTASQFGFIAELNPAGLLDVTAISTAGWNACNMGLKDDPDMLPTDMEGHGIYGRVLRDGKGLFTNSPASHPDAIGFPDGHPALKAFLGVPLIHETRTIGVLCLGNREAGYRQEDLDAVDALAPAVVEALLRKRAERALRESEQRLRTALEGGRMGLWEWDIVDDRSYGDNRLHELLHIYHPEPAPSEVFFRHIHHEDRERLRTQLQETLASGEDFQTEFRAERPHDEIVWLALRSSVLYDDEEQAVRVLGIVFDITQRKQLEDALYRMNNQLEQEVQTQTEELKNTVEQLQDEIVRRRQAEEDLHERSRLLEGFFRHTITPLAFMDREFNFVQVNDAYARAEDRSPDDFTGKNHFVLYPHAENRAIFEEVVRTKHPYYASAKPFRYPDHPERGVTYWNWQLTPLLDDAGRVQFLVLNLQDVTERQAAMEELEKRTSQLQRLTAELSEAEDRERQRLAELLHDDLQQLLVGSKLRLDILARKTRDAPEILELVDEATGLIVESIQKSRGLSHELSPPVLHHGDLREVLQWLVEQIRTTCGLKVRLRIGDGVDVRSQALKTFTYKAAREMLFNVVKHANVKRAAIVVQQKDGSLCLTVSDRGRGFESSRLDIAGQNGFGLLHIRERVQLLGGSMTVQSVPGRGSRIVLKIPRNMAEETTGTIHRDGGILEPPSTVFVTKEAAACVPARPTFRVLLVDDHKVMRDGLAALLEEESDIEVIGQAGNGRDAITLTARLKPDVVVMDVVMPIINGEEATRQIKERWPQVRVVALSMLEEDTTRERMIQAGAEAFLSKAGPSEVIAAAIRRSS